MKHWSLTKLPNSPFILYFIFGRVWVRTTLSVLLHILCLLVPLYQAVLCLMKWVCVPFLVFCSFCTYFYFDKKPHTSSVFPKLSKAFVPCWLTQAWPSKEVKRLQNNSSSPGESSDAVQRSRHLFSQWPLASVWFCQLHCSLIGVWRCAATMWLPSSMDHTRLLKVNTVGSCLHACIFSPSLLMASTRLWGILCSTKANVSLCHFRCSLAPISSKSDAQLLFLLLCHWIERDE